MFVNSRPFITITFLYPQENCSEVILSTESPFKRLDHYKLHEYTRKWNMTTTAAGGGVGGGKAEPISMTLTNNLDAMFKRKRGRPPKNRVVEVRNNFYMLSGNSFCCSYWIIL
jgi:hypothetical protein